MRRARELLAQIVLFGVEFGVGIVGALVGEWVGETIWAASSSTARQMASRAPRIALVAIIFEVLEWK